MTVRAASSVTIPRERSHRVGASDARGGADHVREICVRGCVEGRSRPEREVAFDRASEVLGQDRLTVGVADPGSQLEGVREAAVSRCRQRDGQVGHDLCAVAAADSLERGQAIVGHVQRQDRAD